MTCTGILRMTTGAPAPEERTIVTDRYDDLPAEPAGPAAENDSAREPDAQDPVAHDDARPAARDEGADRPSSSLPDDEGLREESASSAPAARQRDARDHVNAHRSAEPGETAPPSEAPQYGVGPFSLREVSLLGLWAVTFLVSFFPMNNLPANVRVLGGGTNVWLSGLWWIPAVALPTVAVGLLVLRRLSPQGIRRVGSLGIDQFASVAFSVAALVWVAWVWDTVAVAIETGLWTRTWVVWVGAVFTLAGVVLTVFAPVIPPFEQDFQGRPDAPAHRNARPVRAVTPRPPRPRPVRTAAPAEDPQPTTIDELVAHGAGPGSYTGSTEPSHRDAEPATSVLPTHDDTHDTDVISPSPREHAPRAAHDASVRHPQPQAFWALSPEEREVVDDYGTPIFRVGPTAWALVIEDRGETFVIRHDDGRIGYLHDVSGVTRG